ncbi:MAG: hypothetical protein HKM23_08990 [Nitrosopumilus sp.]|nr:hypothetical protein [Nitrosopumilus sp.]
MSRIPEKFPEYSIMYKTLFKKINELKEIKEKSQKSESGLIQLKIEKYQLEINKIKKMFPDGFFDDYE